MNGSKRTNIKIKAFAYMLSKKRDRKNALLMHIIFFFVILSNKSNTSIANSLFLFAKSEYKSKHRTGMLRAKAIRYQYDVTGTN